ncbi:ferritin [bacterium]|nr:ferritin [bacterium]
MELISKEVAAELNQQIGREFRAMLQYLAIANYFHRETLPELAKYFYAQSDEERTHGLKVIQYLHDTGADLDIPGVEKCQYRFSTVEEAVSFSLNEEVELSKCINKLASLARKKDDFATENFLQFFIKEQLEEISSMEDLLATVKRAGPDRLLLVEEYILRKKGSANLRLGE